MIIEKHKNVDSKNDRFTWAASLVSPSKTDQLLEIGCGTGLLVERLATLISMGHILAIDQSVAMIRAAARRNKWFIENGVVQLLLQDYSTSSIGHCQFDKVVAFNVSGFWEKPAKYLPLLKMHLKPDGQFYLFCQPPFDKTQHLAQKAAAVLTANKFFIKNVLVETFEPAPAFCIISVP